MTDHSCEVAVTAQEDGREQPFPVIGKVPSRRVSSLASAAAAAKSAKMVVLVLLLIVGGFLLGKLAKKLTNSISSFFPRDTGFLHSLLKLPLAIAAVAITGGLVTARVRFLWIPQRSLGLALPGCLHCWAAEHRQLS